MAKVQQARDLTHNESLRDHRKSADKHCDAQGTSHRTLNSYGLVLSPVRRRRLSQGQEYFLRSFGAAGVGRTDVKNFALFIDRTVFDTAAGHIHAPEVLDAGSFFLVPSQDAG